MENLDESENNAKVSDSGCSHSGSNSQSRRSSKSTHSGSSSGYGGGNAASPSNRTPLNQIPENRSKDKETKKKKPVKVDTVPSAPVVQKDQPLIELVEDKIFKLPSETLDNVISKPNDELVQEVEYVEDMETAISEKNITKDEDGFSCVISMLDGIVMYTTSSLTNSLGFPKEMWIGRSFIDFVHPKDHSTFASQITSGVAIPKNVSGSQVKDQTMSDFASSMFCRIRKYRGLKMSGFGVKNWPVLYIPFHLKLSFKNGNEEDMKAIYLVIQAKPISSMFKTPSEKINPTPFITRHIANGNLEFIDPESVSYLGYFPQDIINKSVLDLYHPDDLAYLGEVYEKIVKGGQEIKSKPIRMTTQNLDYVKLETEWSTFINPWSRKLEFVVGKHYVVEGPANPNVFRIVYAGKVPKMSDEDEAKVQGLKDNIIRIMNEVLTKPAEDAKQHISKRCQDLATFMESLMEEHPKAEDELRLDIQDHDNSYYERDSVMLGGISPHHNCHDSKSSTETPLSYNRLNYNDTLQRYFNSYMLNCCEDHMTNNDNHEMLLQETALSTSKCLSPLDQTPSDSVGFSSSCDSNALATSSDTCPGDMESTRLTEMLLTMHNVEMEKEFVKGQRETRVQIKNDKGEMSDNKQKKMEHLTRCNASYQPTVQEQTFIVQPHGVKRCLKLMENDEEGHKHHKPSPRLQRHINYSIATTVANTIGMFPMYYVATPNCLATDPVKTENPSAFQTPLQYVMYPQPIFASPFLYPTVSPQIQFPSTSHTTTLSTEIACTSKPLSLPDGSAQKACSSTVPPFVTKSVSASQTLSSMLRRDKAIVESQATCSKTEQVNSVCSSIYSSSNALNRSTEAILNSSSTRTDLDKCNRLGPTEETMDRTDGESSYSSFYSSFFRTESGSAEESFDSKKKKKENLKQNKVNENLADVNVQDQKVSDNSTSKYDPAKEIQRRKMEPPWMDKVCVTSDLVYKYQIKSKEIDDVLKTDKQKIDSLNQSSLVNEQLSQLYVDLQLEGVAARLTLEEGITSSGSSGEETYADALKKNLDKPRRRKEYSKLGMIYEENAPLPSPQKEDETTMSSCD